MSELCMKHKDHVHVVLGMVIGAVVGFFIGGILCLYGQHSAAIDNHVARYNQQTGEFEWGAPR